jgi:hypothetical protein
MLYQKPTLCHGQKQWQYSYKECISIPRNELMSCLKEMTNQGQVYAKHACASIRDYETEDFAFFAGL